MKLAEALAERADLQTRITQLKQRAVRAARIQEGDDPVEDIAVIIEEIDRLMDRLQELIARINATNSVTQFNESWTITDALAARDVLTIRSAFYHDLADAASGRQDRFTRTEVKFVPATDVPAARRKADAACKRLREVDTALQQLNWLTELR